jgi:hypothetical protein
MASFEGAEGGPRQRRPSVRHGNYDLLIRFVRGNRKDASRVFFYARHSGEGRIPCRFKIKMDSGFRRFAPAPE